MTSIATTFICCRGIRQLCFAFFKSKFGAKFNKVNKVKKNEFSAVKGINLSIDEGDFLNFLTIVGPSGCGKSTLLNLISTIDSPTDGKIYIYDREISKMSDDEKAILRRKIFGFVFQQFNLINSFTVLENVVMPMRFENLNSKKAEERGKFLIKQVGLDGKKTIKSARFQGDRCRGLHAFLSKIRKFCFWMSQLPD